MILYWMSNPIQRLLTQDPPAFKRFNETKLSVKCASLIAGCVFLTGLSSSAMASESQTCLPEWIAPLQTVPEENPNGFTQLSAERLIQPNSEYYELQGDVFISQPGTVVLAKHIEYLRGEEQINAFGDVEFHRHDMLILADKAFLNNQNESARLNTTQYQLKESRAHGKAKRIDIDQAANTSHLRQATFSTCPIQDYTYRVRGNHQDDLTVFGEKQAWYIAFDELEINQETRRVIGRNATLTFQNLPVLYTPYFDFPLDDRASGLLFPEFGSYKSITETTSRSYYKQPYYFNIAENMDDTLSALHIEGRGLALDNEFRYLSKTGPVTHSAELSLTGLQDQEVSSNGLVTLDKQDLVYGDPIDSRWRGKLKAQQNWGSGFSSHVLWHEVSDEMFYSDIPIESEYKNASQLQRYVKGQYRQDNWQAYANVVSYLPLRNAPVNYEKRPELGVVYSNYWDNLSFDFQAESTEFEITQLDHSKPEGQRIRLMPTVSYEVRRPFGHIKATAQANHHRYAMQDNGYYNEEPSDFDYTVMQYALEGGLVFERNLSLGGQRYTQTLEPQLHALVVPYVDQSAVPLFDTKNRSLSFNNLFTLNRFTGSDRIGDTRQIAASLISKLISPTGKPLLEAGIGQIFYQQDREVVLRGTEPEIETESDYFVKLAVSTDPIYFSSTAQIDQTNRELVAANSRLRWDMNANSKLLLQHTLTNHMQANEKNTIAAGATLALSENWEVGSYVNYDFSKELRNDVLHTIRYDDCCWAGELSVEETQLENGLYNYTFQFNVEFKGLSSPQSSFRNYLNKKLNF